MAISFIGRDRELKFLEQEYREPRAALVPIYGRRRVGKSELILQFSRGKRSIYYVATQARPVYQIRNFLRAAAQGTAQPWLAEASGSDWANALKLVVESSLTKSKGKLILVLDEFQWLCETSPELPSVLQQLWDQHWQHDPRLFLILCGSYVGFMEREVLGKKSPLFGRRTAQILLPPFSYREAADFHPHWSLEDRACVYFICGGIPSYLKLFSPSRSVAQNIMANFLFPEAPLFREPDFLLREELRDISSYTSIIEALAEGKGRVTELSQHTGLLTNKLPYFLNNLMQLGYVERRLPLLPGKSSRKQTRYSLSDRLLYFWFRFVAPHQSMIRVRAPEHSYESLLKPSLEPFYGMAFERLCREALPLLYLAERVPGKFTIGEFWDSHTQIDVVGLRSDGWVDLGECKWGGRVSATKILGELTQKSMAFPHPGLTIQKRIFTRRRLKSKPLPHVKFHSLEELYAL